MSFDTIAKVVVSNLSLPGSPTTTTQAALDNSTNIATTKYADAAAAVVKAASSQRFLVDTPIAGSFGYPSGASATNIDAQNSQVPFWPAYNATDIRIAFVNASQIGEIVGPRMTIRCQVEYPQGTFWPILFGGQLSGTIDPGGTLLSDPCAFDVTAANPGIIRTNVQRAAGTTVGIPSFWTSSSVSGSAVLSPFTSTRTAGSWDSVELIQTRTVTDGVANGTTTITSATAAFVSSDLGQTVTILGTPYTIITVTSATAVVLSATVSTASGLTVALTPTDKSGTGTMLIGGSLSGYCPFAVLGTILTANAPIALIGDSITKGSGQDLGLAFGSWAMQAMSQTLALAGNGTKICVARSFLEMAQVSDTANAYNALHTTRYRWLSKCKYVLGDFTNDVFILLSTALATETAFNTMATQHKLRGIVGSFYGTLTPRTSSTDNWLTASNQTTTLPSQETIRQAVNGWMRDGGPTDNTTGLPVAVGTSSTTANRCNFYSVTGSISSAASGPNAAAHPFSGGGFFELTNNVEVNSSNVLTNNGGFWRVGSGNRTVTNAAITNGSPTLTSATAAFTSADTGRWCGGPGIPINTKMTFVNSTTITMSKNATSGTGTATSTVTFADAQGNYVSQSDGVHPSSSGIAVIGTAVATWLGTATP